MAALSASWAVTSVSAAHAGAAGLECPARTRDLIPRTRSPKPPSGRGLPSLLQAQGWRRAPDARWPGGAGAARAVGWRPRLNTPVNTIAPSSSPFPGDPPSRAPGLADVLERPGRWCAPTRPMASWAGTSPATPARPTCSRPASTTSSSAANRTAVTWCSPAAQRARRVRALSRRSPERARPDALPPGSPRPARARAGCPATRTLAHPTSGSSPRAPWASAPSAHLPRALHAPPAPRPADTGGAPCGVCSATVRWTSPRA